MNSHKLKVVFGGCARDCAKYLPKTLENIKFYSSLFKESYTIIVENGSKDNTKEILKKNKNYNNFFLFREDINKLPYRGQRLEFSRNLIIETIKNNSKLKNCDLFIMMDLDDMGNYKIEEKNIISSLNFLFSDEKNGAVFANQLGTYYDMWTLRDDKYCKDDFWGEVLKLLIKNKNSHEDISIENFKRAENEFINKKTISFKKEHPPILVNSAFGGFGIYKMKYVLQNKNKYLGTQLIELISKDGKKFQLKYQKCEHVNFNKGLVNQNLKLYILPYLINRGFEENFFPPQVALNFIIKN